MAKSTRLLAGVGATLAAAAIAGRISRHTGVSPAETTRSRVGDEIIAHPTTVWDRGITVAARPCEIWPWLVQMGYGRAGFYVPEWVDQVVWRIPASNRYELVPQFAHMAVGDVLADGPDYIAYWRVKIVEPERALVLWTRRHPWHGVPVDPSLAGYVVVASNYGRRQHPAWYHNLIANPRATITLNGSQIPVIARRVTGDERRRLLALDAVTYPARLSYERRAAGREIGVFSLEPIAGTRAA